MCEMEEKTLEHTLNENYLYIIILYKYNESSIYYMKRFIRKREAINKISNDIII